MPIPAPPFLRQAFHEFCQTGQDWNDDFEYVYHDQPYDPVTPAYIDDNVAWQMGTRRELEAIGITGSGSCIGWWAPPGIPLAERPVVYIDSEGIPAGACANSFAEFLMLLPYGTGLLFEVLRQEEYKRLDLAKNLLLENLSAATLPAKWLAEQAAKYQGHADYVTWLTGEAGLTIAPDPVALIRQAYHRHLGFIEWLGWE